MLVNLEIKDKYYKKEVLLTLAISLIDYYCNMNNMEYNLNDIIAKLSCIEFNLYPKGDRDFSKVTIAKITQVE